VNHHCDVFCSHWHLNVVKFQLKPINFDGMSKGSSVILDFEFCKVV